MIIIMDEEKVKEVLSNHQPVGFLKQLGEALGEVIGLGNPVMEDTGFVSIIKFPVRTKDKVLGEYRIVQSGDETIGVNCVDIKHPLVEDPERIWLLYGRDTKNFLYKNLLVRQDGWKQIVFPGFPQSSKFRTVSYLDGVEMPEITFLSLIHI